jgi:hypothetical protein
MVDSSSSQHFLHVSSLTVLRTRLPYPTTQNPNWPSRLSPGCTSKERADTVARTGTGQSFCQEVWKLLPSHRHDQAAVTSFCWG